MTTYSFFITEDAAKHIDGCMRVGVQGGACQGLKYAIIPNVQPKENDLVFSQFGVTIVIDPKSIVYLNGTTLDWENSLMSQGFVFRNPNETKTCGCGSSFSVSSNGLP